MLSMLIWVVALAFSVASVCLAVAFEAQMAHLGATAIVSLGLVAAAVNEHRSAELAGASEYRLGALAARYMGLLWAWSAISSYVVYAFLLDWPYWMTAVVAMFAVCGVCLFVALLLDREDAALVPDAWAPRLVALMARSQFAMGALLFGLMIAVRRAPDTILGGPQLWVANNLILSTAAGILTLTGYLIMRELDTAAPRAPSEDTTSQV